MTATTKSTQGAAPRSRFSRLGLSIKSTPPYRSTNLEHQAGGEDDDDDDEEWYIPYNGPYELPKVLPAKRRQERDSWGDLVDGEEEEQDDEEGEVELVERGRQRVSGRFGFAVEEPLKARSRTRVLSSTNMTSHQHTPRSSTSHTNSPTMIDPHRSSFSSKRHQQHRQSTHSTHTQHSTHAARVAGGVGESPMPPQRVGTLTTPGGSRSGGGAGLVSFLGLGLGGRKGGSGQPSQPLQFSQHGQQAQQPQERHSAFASSRDRAHPPLPPLLVPTKSQSGSFNANANFDSNPSYHHNANTSSQFNTHPNYRYQNPSQHHQRNQLQSQNPHKNQGLLRSSLQSTQTQPLSPEDTLVTSFGTTTVSNRGFSPRASGSFEWARAGAGGEKGGESPVLGGGGIAVPHPTHSTHLTQSIHTPHAPHPSHPTHLTHPAKPAPPPRIPSLGPTDEDDYYNSYYSTLLSTPTPTILERKGSSSTLPFSGPASSGLASGGGGPFTSPALASSGLGSGGGGSYGFASGSGLPSASAGSGLSPTLATAPPPIPRPHFPHVDSHVLVRGVGRGKEQQSQGHQNSIQNQNQTQYQNPHEHQPNHMKDDAPPTPRAHPYAYVFPSAAFGSGFGGFGNGPLSAPPIPASSSQSPSGGIGGSGNIGTSSAIPAFVKPKGVGVGGGRYHPEHQQQQQARFANDVGSSKGGGGYRAPNSSMHPSAHTYPNTPAGPSHPQTPSHAHAHYAPAITPSRALKSSISTPDLRSAARRFGGVGQHANNTSNSTTVGTGRTAVNPGGSALPRGIDRWLSAETWCDALIFPRPRFRFKAAGGAGTEGGGGSTGGRIVSPPESPLLYDPTSDGGALGGGGTSFGGVGGVGGGGVLEGGEWHGGGPGRGPGMQSRVLAYSRSVTDLKSAAQGVVGLGPGAGAGAGARLGAGLSRVGRKGGEVRGGGGADSIPTLERVPEARSNEASTSKAPMNLSVRPRSFALDDLALPSPVPSLAKVLEEGELLQRQRKEWQAKATSSFGNKRARSLSRTRTKSFNHSHRHKRGSSKDSNDKMGTIGFLAARSMLGNQGVTFVLPPETHSGTNTNGTNTMNTYSEKSASSARGGTSTGTHSHSNSVAKSSKASGSGSGSGSQPQQGHRRTHSRNDSWSRSAIKMAKTTAGVICGLQTDQVSPLDERGAVFEEVGATQPGVQMSDPIDLSLDRNVFATAGSSAMVLPPYAPIGARIGELMGPSPTPSGISVEEKAGVGIALGTPAPSEDHAHDVGLIRMPEHPYAQRGLYTYHGKGPAGTPSGSGQPLSQTQVQTQTHTRHRPKQGSDYAGPHPTETAKIVVTAPADADLNDMSTRHRLPPQVTLHPYAQAGASTSSYQAGIRQQVLHVPSNVPPPAKMWAQISPGVVREVLPSDIRYSPHTSAVPPGDVGYAGEVSGLGSGAVQGDVVDVDEALTAIRSRNNSPEVPEPMRVIDVETAHPEQTVEEQSGQGSSSGIVQTRAVVGTWPQTRRKPHPGDASRPDMTHAFNRYDQQPAVYIDDIVGTAASPQQEVVGPSSAKPSLQGQARPHESSDSSPGVPSSSACSSPQSPRPLGTGSDDLDRFRDLFYQPDNRASLSGAEGGGEGGTPWDVGSKGSRRTGSGLTSLARQLSEELEEMNGQGGGEGGSRVSGGESGSRGLRSSGLSTGLHFVLEDEDPGLSPTDSTLPLRISRSQGTNSAFLPSIFIPEDVESSRASSPMERSVIESDHSPHAFRLGLIEAVSTPPATANDHRRRSGHLSLVDEEEAERESAENNHLRTSNTNLLTHPMSSNYTRSSYLTTSDGSRMSGLSDFPVPPGSSVVTPAHMAFINSYFEEYPPVVEETSRAPQGSPAQHNSRRTTFGVDEDDAANLARALASQP